MSGSSHNTRLPEYWLPGQDYWNRSLPQPSEFIPPRISQTSRGRMGDPRPLHDERSIEGPRSSSQTPRSHQLLLTDNHDAYPITRRPFIAHPYHYAPTYNQTHPPREASTLSKEEQDKALSKLRRQYHIPHLCGIAMRLAATKSTSNNGAAAQTSRDHVDLDMKRCSICLEDFRRGFVMVTPCNHMFHEECIVRWVKSSGKCPVCRFVMVERSKALLHSDSGVESEFSSVMRAFDGF